MKVSIQWYGVISLTPDLQDYASLVEMSSVEFLRHLKLKGCYVVVEALDSNPYGVWRWLDRWGLSELVDEVVTKKVVANQYVRPFMFEQGKSKAPVFQKIAEQLGIPYQ